MTLSATPAQALAGLSAALGWCALALQLALRIGATLAAGGSVAGAILDYFSFFTILTNILVAGLMTVLAAGRAVPAALHGAATLYIAMVALIYWLVLRPTGDPEGWQRVADCLLHGVVPALAIVMWLGFAPKGALKRADLPAWLIYPLAFFGHAMARGAVDGWYPYPFLDAGRFGYRTVLQNAVVVTAVFAALAVTIVWLDGRLARRGGKTPSGSP